MSKRKWRRIKTCKETFIVILTRSDDFLINDNYCKCTNAVVECLKFGIWALFQANLCRQRFVRSVLTFISKLWDQPSDGKLVSGKVPFLGIFQNIATSVNTFILYNVLRCLYFFCFLLCATVVTNPHACLFPNKWLCTTRYASLW